MLLWGIGGRTPVAQASLPVGRKEYRVNDGMVTARDGYPTATLLPICCDLCQISFWNHPAPGRRQS